MASLIGTNVDLAHIEGSELLSGMDLGGFESSLVFSVPQNKEIFLFIAKV